MSDQADPLLLSQRVSLLERENRLLRTGVKQLARIREQWTRSLTQLQQTKAELQVANRFLDQLLQTAPLPVVLLTRPHGRIVMANAAAAALVGAEFGGLSGKRWLGFLDSVSRRLAAGHVAAAADHDPRPPIHVRLVTLQRDIRQLELHMTSVPGGSDAADHVMVIARDVTERDRAQEALRLAAKIIEASPQGILVLGPDGSIVDANRACATFFSHAADDLIGGRTSHLFGPTNAHVMSETVWPAVEREGEWQGEIILNHADGKPRTLWLIVRTLTTPSAEISHYVLLLVDITRQKRVEERLRFLSMHDPLTGLPNRALYRERLEQALASSRRSRNKTAVLFLDLDGFKHVNDSLGHDAGDKLLIEVGGRLQATLRETDTIARFGGDEFAVILPDVKRIGDIEAVARLLLETIAAPFHINDDVQRVTASIGVSLYPDDGSTVDDLSRFADEAMYEAKAAGKNAYRCYSRDLNHALATRLTLLSGMHPALERDEFVLHYQPQLTLDTRQVHSLEALVRWQHPSLGLVPPAQFIGLAEESGFIAILGEHVLRRACAQLAAWRAAGHDDLSIAVNLSGRQFRDDSLVATVAKALAEAGLPPQFLHLEVTESAVIENLDAAASALRQLGQMGVQIVLDDFGTGHASMLYLKRLPFHKLKIDRQFVSGLEAETGDVAVTTAIVNMARSLGLTVVAEGVETVGQLNALAEIGCEAVQGYYIARPLPADACERFLRQQRCVFPMVHGSAADRRQATG